MLIGDATKDFMIYGGGVTALEADLATIKGVEKLYAATQGRPVDALLANAGRGLGQGFLDQDFNEIIRVIDTNITGTIYLIKGIGVAAAIGAAATTIRRRPKTC